MSTLTIYEETLKFPMSSDDEVLFNKLVRLLGSVERVEECFQLEFQLEEEGSDISLYDPPRLYESVDYFYTNKPYKFTIKQIGENEGEIKYFINNKVRYTEDFD
jgi:hypothetical protein